MIDEWKPYFLGVLVEDERCLFSVVKAEGPEVFWRDLGRIGRFARRRGEVRRGHDRQMLQLVGDVSKMLDYVCWQGNANGFVMFVEGVQDTSAIFSKVSRPIPHS